MSEKSEAILAEIDSESSTLARHVLSGPPDLNHNQTHRDRLATLRADLALELQGGPK